MGLEYLRSYMNSCSVCDGRVSPWNHLDLAVGAHHGAQSICLECQRPLCLAHVERDAVESAAGVLWLTLL